MSLKKRKRKQEARDGDVRLRLSVHAEGHAAHRSRWRFGEAAPQRRCGRREKFSDMPCTSAVCRAEHLKFPSGCSLFSCSVTNIQPLACTCFTLLSSSELRVSARTCCCCCNTFAAQEQSVCLLLMQSNFKSVQNGRVSMGGRCDIEGTGFFLWRLHNSRIAANVTATQDFVINDF